MKISSSSIEGIRLAEAVVDRDKKIIYFWSPKSACTSVVKSVLDSMGKLNEALSYSEWVHDYRSEILCGQRMGMVEFRQQHSDYRKIFFVRNPYDRAASCYSHFTSFVIEKHDIKNEWTQQTFLQFLGFLESSSFPSGKPFRPHSVLYHAYPQLPTEDCLLRESIDDIIKVEDILTNRDIFGNLDLDLKPEHFKVGNSYHHFSSYRKGSSREFYKELYQEDGTREMVERLYSSDLEYLGYTWEDFASETK